MRDFKEYTILNAVTPKAVTSSTDATPIVMTVASHGFSTGDLVLQFGHTTNIAANGIFRVTVLSANTYSLQDRDSGANIAGSGGGAGASGLAIPAPKILFVEDFRHVIFSLFTGGSATTTVKVAGSIGKLNGDMPNFGGTQNAANPYSYMASINLQDGASVAGDTGVVVAGTDFARQYEVNVNGLKYVTMYPISWTQGSITIKAQVFNDQ